MSDRETLILVISRLDLDPTLIPPLKVIIPMLSNLYPVRIYNSIDGEVKATKTTTLYEELVKKLEGSGFCCLNKILEDIIKQNDQLKNNNYRICIMGNERADWSAIMELKRRGIVVDTISSSAEKNQFLVQISYITNGIHKSVKESTMIKTFEGELGLSSKARHYFKIDKKETVEFSLKCWQCSVEITGPFFGCSVCLAVYCPKHELVRLCSCCHHFFDCD